MRQSALRDASHRKRRIRDCVWPKHGATSIDIDDSEMAYKAAICYGPWEPCLVPGPKRADARHSALSCVAGATSRELADCDAAIRAVVRSQAPRRRRSVVNASPGTRAGIRTRSKQRLQDKTAAAHGDEMLVATNRRFEERDKAQFGGSRCFARAFISEGSHALACGDRPTLLCR